MKLKIAAKISFLPNYAVREKNGNAVVGLFGDQKAAEIYLKARAVHYNWPIENYEIIEVSE